MKKMTLMACAAVAVLSLAGVASAGDSPLSKPEVLGEETIFTTERLARYDTVVVKDFSTEGAEFVNLDDEEKKVVAEITPEIVKNLTDSTVKYLKKSGKFKSVKGNAAATGNAMVVEGKFTRFNGGIGAAKFFLGFMAPEGAKTNISVNGRLVDAKTGKELAKFSDTRSGGEGGGLGRIKGVMPVQATDEGEEIANFIEKLY